LRRATTYPLAVKTALAWDGEVNEAVASWTSTPGFNQFLSKSTIVTSAAKTIVQIMMFLIRPDLRGEVAPGDERSMRSEDKSVSRVAIK